jgi:phosphinothricin acetyltransferase
VSRADETGGAVTIRPVTVADWPAVQAIYAEGIATGNATFETVPREWDEWNSGHHEVGRLVAVRSDVILGWAALSPVSKREVYAGVAEVSVYVAATARSQGIGKALLASVIEHAEDAGLWTLQAAVFPENHATLRLHKSAGFREVGRRERIGRHFGRWRDTVLLERRSARVGV